MVNLFSTFVAVVDAGSFSEAARRMGQPKSAVSRKVEQLEEHLGVRLLQRSTRAVRPTDIGQEYYRRCVQILAQIEDAEQLVRQDQQKPAGKLRVQLPIELGTHVFGRLLAEYARDNPKVSLEIELSNRQADMVEDQYDLAIRVGAMPDSSLISRKILSIHYGFYASPSYLARAGEPTNLEDLRAHSCLRFQTDYISGDWQITMGKVKATFQPSGAATVNSLVLLREAAVAGLGIVMMPSLLCDEAVSRGQLQPVLREWQAEDVEVFVLYPSRQHLSMKVKGFLSFLDQRLEQLAAWMSTSPNMPSPPTKPSANGREQKGNGNGRATKNNSSPSK